MAASRLRFLVPALLLLLCLGLAPGRAEEEDDPLDDSADGEVTFVDQVNRAMDLIGKQRVGKHVWYDEGATAILGRLQRLQVKDPIDPRAPEQDAVFWTDQTHEPKDVLATCFALLFLERATRDIIDVPVTGGERAPVDNR